MGGNWPGIIAVAVTIIWFTAILVWILKQRYGKAKTVKATVIHKQISDSFSKYSGNTKLFYITFQIGRKHRSFKVSEFSYHGYRIGESGMLKYKADRIIDFS